MNLLTKYLLSLWHDAASTNNKMLSSYVELTRKAKILDLGCGNGIIAKDQFAGKIDQPDIFGLEINPQDIRIARKNGLRVITGDVEKRFPFQDNDFDVVSANQLIEHLFDTDSFLQDIFRVLKPHGYLLLASENLASWHNIAALFVGWHPFSLHASDKSNIGNPFHLGSDEGISPLARHKKVFTLRSLLEAVRLHGFTVEQSFGAGYYPLPPFLAREFAKIDATHAAFIGLKARKK